MLEDGAHRHLGPLGDARRRRTEVALVDQRDRGIDDGLTRAQCSGRAAIDCFQDHQRTLPGMSDMTLLALSDAILRGEEEITDHHPFRPSNRLEEVGDGVAFVESFANVAAIATPTGSASSTPAASSRRPPSTARCGRGRRSERPRRCTRTATSTTSSARPRSRPKGRCASSATTVSSPRFDRYRKTAGYNAVINQRQFQAPGLEVAARVPPARRHLQRPARPRPRRRGRRAAPRPRRDRRPHVGVGPRAPHALHRRPHHLVHAERGEPAEGAALRRGLGRRVARDGRARARRCSCPDTGSRSPAPTTSAWCCSTRRRCSSRWRRRRWR